MLNNFTDEQKKIYEEVKEELLMDNCVPGRMEEQEHRRLVSAYEHLRRMEQEMYAVPVILNGFISRAEKALIPYRKWREENILGEGHGIDEDKDLTPKQRKILKKVNEILDQEIDAHEGNVTEEAFRDDSHRLLLLAWSEYNFYSKEKKCYAPKFIEGLIQQMGIFAILCKGGKSVVEVFGDIGSHC